ncbi:MAG: ATP-binding protein [Desulfarculaceae bacterium]|nr:ATP-binding protein [Desulfarculaceae bacterium]MCF8046707.1 ATP-binding protein [Desulfarculaceae bacterium]MCF8066110.1 ATP-binding protein [Desulfarculaceae bacterium]MCF8099918.1 ATP-binding protein [Desulfarculaceae bacterium]MCF8124384.1 ATP-binding protein [Desulfarculaceae bacterium]
MSKAEHIKQDSHREALATLLYSIEQSEGWALVVGRAGSGKTQLMAELRGALGTDVTCVHLSAEDCPTPMDLFRRISEALALGGPCQYKARFLLDLREAIQEYRRRGQKILILIDSAQHWGPEMLREIELLGNEDQFSPRVLNIFLMARPEFLNTLEAMGATNLKQNLRRFRRLASPCDIKPPTGERRCGPRQDEGIDYFDNQAAKEMRRLAGAKIKAQRIHSQAQAEEPPAAVVAKSGLGGIATSFAPEPTVDWPDSQEEINALLDLVFGPTPPRA